MYADMFVIFFYNYFELIYVVYKPKSTYAIEANYVNVVPAINEVL